MKKTKPGKPVHRPAPNQVFIFQCKKSWIDSMNIDEPVHILEGFISEGRRVVALANSLSLMFPDYVSDPREVFEIPEIRKWMAALTARFPYWLTFLSKDDESLQLLLMLLVDGCSAAGESDGLKSWRVDVAQTRQKLRELTTASFELFERYDIPEKDAELLMEDVVQACGTFLG